MNFTNGDPPEITARELFDCTELDASAVRKHFHGRRLDCLRANIAALVPVADKTTCALFETT